MSVRQAKDSEGNGPEQMRTTESYTFKANVDGEDGAYYDLEQACFTM